MHLEEQHNKDNIQMERLKSNKSVTCDVCHGSGSNADGTISYSKGTGII